MKIKAIMDDCITMDNGVTVMSVHQQDCCEQVYCDFSSLLDSPIMDIEFEKIKIEAVKGEGIRINGYFCPCYDLQNGYYSSNLNLVIDYQDGRSEVYNLEKMEVLQTRDPEYDFKDN
jgi:hypothetical protein